MACIIVSLMVLVRWYFALILKLAVTIMYAKDDNVITALQAIRRLGVEPMQNPFEYVSHIQKDFDYWNIPFSDEFYDITGIEKS